jgi:hypothetical protein
MHQSSLSSLNTSGLGHQRYYKNLQIMAVSSTKQKVLCVGENKIGIENYPHLSTDEKIRTNFILGAFFYFQT